MQTGYDTPLFYKVFAKNWTSHRLAMHHHFKGTCFSILPLGSWLFFPIFCDLHICPLSWEAMPIGGQRWATHRSLWHAISHLLLLNIIWWVLTSSIFPLKTLCLIELELPLLSCHVLCLGRFKVVSS